MNLKLRIQQKENQLNGLVDTANKIEAQRKELEVKKDELIRQIITMNGAVQELKELQREESDEAMVSKTEKIEAVPAIEEGSKLSKE